MANIGFGLDTNENAKTNGYDLYKSTLGETLGANVPHLRHNSFLP